MQPKTSTLPAMLGLPSWRRTIRLPSAEWPTTPTRSSRLPGRRGVLVKARRPSLAMSSAGDFPAGIAPVVPPLALGREWATAIEPRPQAAAIAAATKARRRLIVRSPARRLIGPLRVRQRRHD